MCEISGKVVVLAEKQTLKNFSEVDGKQFRIRDSIAKAVWFMW